MNQPIIIDDIKPSVSAVSLAKRLHVEKGSEDYTALMGFVNKAEEIAVPKAAYTTSFIEEHGVEYVVIDGIKIYGKVICHNLKDVYRIFPYLVTCGQEIEQWSKTVDDLLYAYWVDHIKQDILGNSIKAFRTRIKQRLQLGKTAEMNPGSLPDFPLAQQNNLFMFLNNASEQIGVELTGSLLMVPSKTVSGLLFETSSAYTNCALCLRQNCEGRKAPFDSVLYRKIIKE